MGRVVSCLDALHGCGMGKKVGRVEESGNVPFSCHSCLTPVLRVLVAVREQAVP